jgi:hypothetical protein
MIGIAAKQIPVAIDEAANNNRRDEILSVNTPAGDWNNNVPNPRGGRGHSDRVVPPTPMLFEEHSNHRQNDPYHLCLKKVDCVQSEETLPADGRFRFPFLYLAHSLSLWAL